jgi:hypothetical protein
VTRPVLITLMLVLPAIDLIILAIGAMTLKSFKNSHKKIATQTDLGEFKKLVKLHKYLALASIPILYAPGLLFLLGLVILGQLTVFPDILFSLVPSLVIIGAAKLMGGLQNDVETLPVENDALKQERDRIVGVWHSRALPDW